MWTEDIQQSLSCVWSIVAFIHMFKESCSFFLLSSLTHCCRFVTIYLWNILVLWYAYIHICTYMGALWLFLIWLDLQVFLYTHYTFPELMCNRWRKERCMIACSIYDGNTDANRNIPHHDGALFSSCTHYYKKHHHHHHRAKKYFIHKQSTIL